MATGKKIGAMLPVPYPVLTIHIHTIFLKTWHLTFDLSTSQDESEKPFENFFVLSRPLQAEMYHAFFCFPTLAKPLFIFSFLFLRF